MLPHLSMVEECPSGHTGYVGPFSHGMRIHFWAPRTSGAPSCNLFIGGAMIGRVEVS